MCLTWRGLRAAGWSWSEDYIKVSSILREFYDVFEEEAQRKGITFLHEDNVVHQHVICDGTKIREIMINLLSNAIKYTPDGGTVSLITTELPCSEEGYVRIKTESYGYRHWHEQRISPNYL